MGLKQGLIDFLQRKAGSALATRIVPRPLGHAVAILPERVQLPGVAVFYFTLVAGGITYRAMRHSAESA